MQQAKKRLNLGGTMMLWIPYDAPLDDMKTHLRTFRGEFRHATFITGRAGIYLFGSDASMPFDDSTLRAGLERPGVLADLSDTPDGDHDTSAGWAEYVRRNIWLSDGKIDRFLGPGPKVTDDRPRSEYYFWRRLFAGNEPRVTRDAMWGAAESITGPYEG